jgi:hypothetical protein
MHLYWTGVAADLHRGGDHSLDWLLEVKRPRLVSSANPSAGNRQPLRRA